MPSECKSVERHRWPTMLLLLLLSWLLSGCAWPPIDTPRATLIRPPESGSTIAGAGSTKSGDWPRRQWWKRFGSSELNRLITVALQDSPTLRWAATRVHQAQAMADARAAELLPLATSGLAVSEQHYSANSIQAKLAGQSFAYVIINPVQMQYHLDLWGRDRATLDEAMGIERAHEAELAQSAVTLAAAVARTYFRLIAAVEQERIAGEILGTQRTMLGLEQARYTFGLDSKIELHTARTGVDEAVQRHRAAAIQASLLRDQLAVLAGQGPDWGGRIHTSEVLLPDRLSIPENVPLGLIAHRPDVIAARFRVEAASKGIAAAEAAFYPDINLRGFAGIQSVSLIDVLFQGSSLAFAVGPTLDLPLFQGGRLEANLEHQRAQYDSAVETYNGTVLRAAQEVADALARWNGVREQRVRQQQELASYEANQRLAAVLHDHGLRDRNRVLVSLSSRDDQRLRLKTLEAEQLRAIVDFVEALGGGFEIPGASQSR